MNRLLWNSLIALLIQATKCQKLNPVLPFEPDPREFCESQVFEPHCPPGHVVMITEARYGRMQIGRCVETDYGYLGCHSDVLQHLDYACSGRQNCTMRVPDHVLDKTNHSCPKEFKTYLNVSHKCIPVVSDACYSCSITQQARITQSSGYIASTTTAVASLTSGQPCGSARCPWRIEVDSGQTIELTLYDFSMEDRQALYTAGLVGGGGGGEYGGSCYRYAIIKEEMSPRDTPICGGRGRVKVIYSSVTNIVEIHVVSPEAFIKLGHFVIHYQAIGCPDYVVAPNEWVKRHGMTLKIGCQKTDDVWELKCNDTQWTGAGKSCPDNLRNTTPAPLGTSLSGGLLISIVIGIAFVVAVFIVTVGVVCLKRQRSVLPPCPDQYYDQRSLQQYYEMREDFRTIEIPASTICKPSSAGRQQKTQQQLTFRNTPAGRRNLYGAPRMDKRPLPSLPNIVETCSLDSPSSEALNAFGGVRRTVQADINTGERSASLRDRAPGVFLQPGKARHTPVSVGTSSQVPVSSRTSNIPTQQSGPQTAGGASACTAFSSSYPPPQHYTVLDPIEVRLMTGNLPHVSGCGGVQSGPCPMTTNATPDCGGLQGENSACAQSYRSHSDDGSTSGSSEEAHLHNISCHEIPLRPMREGSHPAVESNNSGNCSWP